MLSFKFIFIWLISSRDFFNIFFYIILNFLQTKVVLLYFNMWSLLGSKKEMIFKLCLEFIHIIVLANFLLFFLRLVDNLSWFWPYKCTKFRVRSNNNGNFLIFLQNLIIHYILSFKISFLFKLSRYSRYKFNFLLLFITRSGSKLRFRSLGSLSLLIFTRLFN